LFVPFVLITIISLKAANTTTTKPSTTNTPIQPKVTTTPDGQMKIVKNIANQSVVSGKTTLTSLLTSNSNKLVGRRLLMTKAADGTTRVVANAANILPKNLQNAQQSLIKVQTTGAQPTLQTVQIQQPVTTTSTPVKQNETPQRVQIMRTPDGRITVKGLLPGQQLVQYPDGKLQVMTNAQLQSSGLTVKTPTTTTPIKPLIKPSPNTSLGKVVVQGNQLKPANQQQQQQSPVKTQQVLVKTPGTPVVQKVATPNTVVVSGGQVIQQQVVISGNQVIGTPGQQVITNQIVVNNQSLAQQIASGKVQMATINGQQVLIRPTGNNQAQVVAQLTPGNLTQLNTGQTAVATPVKQTVAQAQTVETAKVVQTPQQTIQTTVKPPVQRDNAGQNDQTTMEQLLAGQPPGTVIKCVTAQVIQTPQGPRIVLQGLQGADFTAQQLAAVQQQVKQQLLKGEFSFDCLIEVMACGFAWESLVEFDVFSTSVDRKTRRAGTHKDIPRRAAEQFRSDLSRKCSESAAAASSRPTECRSVTLDAGQSSTSTERHQTDCFNSTADERKCDNFGSSGTCEWAAVANFCSASSDESEYGI
jgi:nucleosome-remodeling factor subunit BPTF